jgi:hypothetical protein
MRLWVAVIRRHSVRTNAEDGNVIVVYDRAGDGRTRAAGSVANGGLGTGSGLGSQSALALADDFLFAGDAGSDAVSVLDVATSVPDRAHAGRWPEADQRDGASRPPLCAERRWRRQHHRLPGRRRRHAHAAVALDPAAGGSEPGSGQLPAGWVDAARDGEAQRHALHLRRRPRRAGGPAGQQPVERRNTVRLRVRSARA